MFSIYAYIVTLFLSLPIFIIYHFFRYHYSDNPYYVNIIHAIAFYLLTAILILSLLSYESKSFNISIVNARLGTNFSVNDISNHSEWHTGEEAGSESEIVINDKNEKLITAYIQSHIAILKKSNPNFDIKSHEMYLIFEENFKGHKAAYYYKNKRKIKFTEHDE